MNIKNIKLIFVGMMLISFAPLTSAIEMLSNTVNVTLDGALSNSDTVIIQVISPIQPVPTLSTIGLLLLVLMMLMAAIVVKRMYKQEYNPDS